MAEMLIRRWRLAVLRVRLVFGPDPAVATELVAYPDGTAQTLWSGRYPFAEFGLSEGRTPPTRLTVPADLVAQVNRVLATQLNREAALWLRLVPPYGHLGAVPWERALATGVPLLRVPDRFPAAVDPGRTFTAVIVVNARPGADWAGSYVRLLLSALRQRLAMPLDVHVFADAGTVTQLRGIGWGTSWEHLHEPGEADRSAQTRSETRQNRLRMTELATDVPGQKWADWIAAGLAGRAARAVHIVLDGAWNGDRPALAVSPDPAASYDPAECIYVDAEQVQALTDALGAATLSFGSPPGNPADNANRMIADSLGQQRNGPTLYSSIEDDRGGAGLAAAYTFVTDGTADVPQDGSLFAYLQPEHVLGALAEPWPDDLGRRPGAADPGTRGWPAGPETIAPAVPPELQSYYSDASEVASWVASAARYVEAGSAGLAHGPAANDDGYELKRSYDKGTNTALTEIQDMVARHVQGLS